jgi:hypothetical protein
VGVTCVLELWAGSFATSSKGDIVSSSIHAEEDSTTRCKFCRQMISSKARKCIHCGSDLTWKRHLSIGTTTLAILTALISVSASAIPAIYNSIAADDSEISAVYIAPINSRESYNITLLASNSGRKPGAITQASLLLEADVSLVAHLDPESKAKKLEIGIPLSTERMDPEFIEGGSTKVIKLNPFGQLKHSGRIIFATDINQEKTISDLSKLFHVGEAEWFDKSRCSIELRIMNASGKETSPPAQIPADCWRLEGIVQAVAQKLVDDDAKRQNLN